MISIKKDLLVVAGMGLMAASVLAQADQTPSAKKATRKPAAQETYDCILARGNDKAEMSVTNNNTAVNGKTSQSNRQVSFTMLDGTDVGTSQVGVSFSANNGNPKLYLSTEFPTGTKHIWVSGQTDPADTTENDGWLMMCTRTSAAIAKSKIFLSNQCKQAVVTKVKPKLGANETASSYILDPDTAGVVDFTVTHQGKDDNDCEKAGTAKISAHGDSCVVESIDIDSDCQS